LPAENDEADETDENVAEKEKQNNASENDLN
jgi:hypothetical protein